MPSFGSGYEHEVPQTGRKPGFSLPIHWLLAALTLLSSSCGNDWQTRASMADLTPRPACQLASLSEAHEEGPSSWRLSGSNSVGDDESAPGDMVFTEVELLAEAGPEDVPPPDDDDSVGAHTDEQSVVAAAEVPGVPCVNLNTATEVELVTLPGVGPGRAKKIIEARAQKPFEKRRQIKRIKGIGSKTYDKMKDQLCEL